MAEGRGRMIAGARKLLGHNRDEALVAGVRRRDRRAFEAIYERHAAQLLTFCVYLLGSRHDAEDALQATFASAYRALLDDTRPVSLRPWLFTIARNESLSILRKRRPQVELNGEVALTGDPVKLAEVHEELVNMIGGIRELPEKQRAALVLAEVHGMSHAEIGEVLHVRPEQVKAYVFQARSNLLSERHAREVDCHEIREELATTHGLKRARLRRHLRSCDGCRAYADGVEHQQRQLASLLPILPSLTLRYRAIDQALGLYGSDAANYANSATMAGTALEVAGGGVTALVAKVATGIVAVGASAGVGMTVIDAPPASHSRPAMVRSAGSHSQLASASTRSRVPRGGFAGEVQVAAGGAGGSGGRGASSLAGGKEPRGASRREAAEREGSGEAAGSYAAEDGAGSGRPRSDAHGSGGGEDGALTPLEQRRQAAAERRQQRIEAREQKQRERKEGAQPTPAGAEGLPSTPVRQKHTAGEGGSGAKGGGSGKEGAGKKAGGKEGGSSGSGGAKGEGKHEREKVHARGPNKNRKRWEERAAERKRKREQKRERKRHESAPETQEATP
ncbi:MAG TPA: sigma-70 family RNA polymerase sigma factor [Solirubrobacteraceae bacterium]|nr:sigma-70 family RNA polymerase sigma factor [Solirubrobacteraceae bacterium]